MYLMMQYADMGQIASPENENSRAYHANLKVIEYVANKLTNEEEFKEYATDCASMKERVCRFLFSQIANGLEYLHFDALIANRDIKPENILFTTKLGGTNIYSHDRAQITDFTTVFKLQEET